MAKYIAKRDWLKGMVRFALKPLVWLAKLTQAPKQKLAEAKEQEEEAESAVQVSAGSRLCRFGDSLRRGCFDLVVSFWSGITSVPSFLGMRYDASKDVYYTLKADLSKDKQ